MTGLDLVADDPEDLIVIRRSNGALGRSKFFAMTPAAQPAYGWMSLLTTAAISTSFSCGMPALRKMPLNR